MERFGPEALPVSRPGRRQKKGERLRRGIIPIIQWEFSSDHPPPIGYAASRKPSRGRAKGKSLPRNGSMEHTIEKESPKYYSVENTTTSKSD
jgi:hypothetical protein